LAVRFADPSFVESVRLRYFDQLVTSQPKVDVPVSVVNIDEATLDKLGQFPFPRDYYANIVKELYAHDAGLVVFNVLMPEKDRFKQDPEDVIEKGVTGFMNEHLYDAVTACLQLDRDRVYKVSQRWSWQRAWEIFRDNLVEKSDTR